MSDRLHVVTLHLCEACIYGQGGECHTPGCAFWMSSAPDLSIREALEQVRDAPIGTREHE